MVSILERPGRRALAQALGTADIASSDSEATVGMIITPTTRPAASALVNSTSNGKTSLQQRGDEGQGEEAVDHGGDAREDLEDRLEDLRVLRAAYSER